MRVAISGIGIAGPTLAYWLRRFGHEPILLERAPALRTGGYVIDFWGLGYDLAERMGLLPALLERGYQMERLSMVDADGRETAGMDVRPMRERLNGRMISIARSDLAAAIFAACDGVPTRFGVTITAVRQHAADVTLNLSDGSEERVDLVVGADGLHSSLRSLVFGDQPQFETMLGCHVAAFRMPDYPKRDELTYVSHTVPKRHVARIALRGNDTLALLICRSEALGGEPRPGEHKAALRRAFGDLRWEVPDILNRMETAGDLYFDRVSQIKLPEWSHGRAALIGDAAACVSLLAGEGTGLAMIEAYVLAGELHRARGNLPAALTAFEAKLRHFVTGKQQSATQLRGFFVPNTGFGLAVRNLIVRALSLPVIGGAIIGRTLDDDFVLPEYR